MPYSCFTPTLRHINVTHRLLFTFASTLCHVTIFPSKSPLRGDIASTKIFPRRARDVNRMFDNGQ